MFFVYNEFIVIIFSSAALERGIWFIGILVKSGT